MSNKSHPMVGGESYPPLQIAEGAVPTGSGSTISIDWSQLTNAPTDNTAASLADANVYTVAQANAAFLTAAAAASTYAPLASPALTGAPTAPTQSPGDNSTKLATTAFVTAAISAAVGAISGTTFATCAATTPFAGTNVSGVLTATSTGTVTIDGHLTALGDNVLFVDQATAADNGLYVVTTAGAVGVAAVFTRVSTLNTSADISAGVIVQVYGGSVYNETSWILPPGTYTINSTGLVFTIVGGAYFAPLASPALTGNPTAPTQTAGDNSTKLATTAFVSTAVGTANVKYLLGTPDVPPGTAATIDDEFTAGSLAGKWTWYNQTPSGQPTAAATFDSVTNITISRAANSAGNHYPSFIGQPLSNVTGGGSSSWSISAKVSLCEPMHTSAAPGTVGTVGVGLFLYESSTVKWLQLGITRGSGVGYKWGTGFGGVSLSGNSFPQGSSNATDTQYWYVRFSFNSSNSNLYLWISSNGRAWELCTNGAYTTWFTSGPNIVGIGIENTNNEGAGIFDWFRDTTSIQAP